MLPCSGTMAFPVALWVQFSGFLVDGRDGDLRPRCRVSDPGEHDGQQLVPGRQPQGQDASVMDQAGWDAEQFMAQSGGMRAAVLVDPGECLQEVERFPARSAAHIHTVFTA